MKKQTVREVALQALLQIENQQAYSNLLLNETIKSAKLDPRDVGLLTEMVYGTIQRKNTLDYHITPFVKGGIKKLEKWVLILLRLSLYQMMYLDRIPERAIVHEAVEIAKKRGHRGISAMVNGILRAIIREGLTDTTEIKQATKRLAIEFSHPEWLVERWVEQFGEAKTVSICKINNTAPEVTARVNQIKAKDRAEVIELLGEQGVQAEVGTLSMDALKIKKGKLPTTQLYKDGWLTIQDESSMLVARALGPTPGMKVLDSCAAPGGKTTHIAELMNGEGEIHALDIHQHKVNLISEQAKRLHLTNIHPVALDSRKAATRFSPNSFDYILVDAPCSGFGVIRRKPDIKWQKHPTDIAKIATVQMDILTAVAPLLKQGGRLVYSTCTIDKQENEMIVEEFLGNHKNFKLDLTLPERMPEKLKAQSANGMVQLLPDQFETDGFFICALVKND